jgi:cell fate regulator YaaT (PSP1 superfamily)
MACAGCSTTTDSKAAGCQSSGCSTGGCNRLNTYDWLSDIKAAVANNETPYIEVSFKNGSRKEFYKCASNIHVDKHDWVVVEGDMGGYDIGMVSITGEMVRLQMKRKRIAENREWLKVLRQATSADLQKMQEARALEHDTMIRARAIARQLNLEMKIGDVEYRADGKKATFYYIADDRVDFRELIKVYAKEFRVKIEMCHIGARQEAARIGGIGSCGRELCCSTWLTEYKSVNTQAARYQNLSINQVKLSGQCGRLKCCLNYELDTYLDALKGIPQHITKIATAQGELYLQKIDIFKRILWFSYKDSSTFHPLTPERVMEIEELNKKGVMPEELGEKKIERQQGKAAAEEEIKFADVVGQTTLESLGKKKKKKNKNKNKEKVNREHAKTETAQADINPVSAAPKTRQNNVSKKNKTSRPKPNKDIKKW